MRRSKRHIRPPKQSAFGAAFVIIVLAVVLLAWLLTTDSGRVWP